jgi:hypothetical protein
MRGTSSSPLVYPFSTNRRIVKLINQLEPAQFSTLMHKI